MSEIVKGLFGVSPDELTQQRNAQLNTQASAFAQMSPEQQATYSLYRGGNQLAGAVGGMMGAQDPQMQKAADIQAILKNFDPTTVEGIQGAAQALGQRGHAQEAMTLAAKAEEMKLKSSQATYNLSRAEAAMKKAKTGGVGGIGKINPGLYTAESVQAYADSIDSGKPDYKLLLPRNPIEKKQANTAIGKRVLEEGIAPGTPEFYARAKELHAQLSDKGAEGVAKASSSTAAVSSGLETTDTLLSQVSGADPTVFFGPVSNFKAWAESTGFLGEPSDNTKAQDNIRSHIIDGINAVLNEAKGVQARDDAERAKKQIQGMLGFNSNAGATAALNRLKQAQEKVIKSNEAYIESRNPNAKPTAAATTPASAKPPAGQPDYAAAFERAKATTPAWRGFTLEQFIAKAKADAAKAKGQ